MTLNTNYMISPNLQEYFVDKTTGAPLAAGNVFYYSDTERSTLKNVYTLVAGLDPGTYVYTPLPNPVPLSGVGTTTDGFSNDVRVYYYPYDANGQVENYYIVVKDADGLTQFTRQSWPNLETNPPEENNYTYNFVRNWTFYSWSFGTTFTDVKVGSLTAYDFFIDDWLYQQSDSSQSINISRVTFEAGADPTGINVPYYVDYQCTSIGSGLAVFNRFEQLFQSVQTLNGNDVVASIWLKKVGVGTTPVSISLIQYFGTGGTPHANVETTILDIPDLTTEWKQYTGTNLLPSISGMQIGTGGDDCLELCINMPLNQTARVNIGPVRLEEGIEIAGSQQISNDTIKQETNTFGLYPSFTTGDIKLTLKNTSDPGWLLMDNTSIGKPGSGAAHIGWVYKALFSLIWTNVHNNTYAPISGGVFGASAEADWDAGKTIGMTTALGRALAVAGSGAGLTARALGQNNVGEETHTLTAPELAVHQHAAPGGANFAITGGASLNISGALAGTTSNATGDGGGGLPHNNMQPSIFYNVMIKI